MLLRARHPARGGVPIRRALCLTNKNARSSLQQCNGWCTHGLCSVSSGPPTSCSFYANACNFLGMRRTYLNRDHTALLLLCSLVEAFALHSDSDNHTVC